MKMSAPEERRITACHAGPGGFFVPCGQGPAIKASVFLRHAGKADVRRPARTKHTPIRSRKGRTIFRKPTKGSLPAEDRAALFHSFGRDTDNPCFCPAVSFFRGLRGGSLTHTSTPSGKKYLFSGAVRSLLMSGRSGSDTLFDPTTLSKLFFA